VYGQATVGYTTTTTSYPSQYPPPPGPTAVTYTTTTTSGIFFSRSAVSTFTAEFDLLVPIHLLFVQLHPHIQAITISTNIRSGREKSSERSLKKDSRN
jgi:hypothetical protein